MNIYAFSSLLASYLCFLPGILVYLRDPKNQLNRVFMLLCISLGYFALAEFGWRQATDFRTAYMWLKVGSFWPFVVAFLIHAALLFTKKFEMLTMKTYTSIYVPALVFSLLDATTPLVSGAPYKEYWGWTYSVPENPLLYNISNIWGFSLMLLSFMLCLAYFYRTNEPIERKKTEFVLIGLLIPILASITTDGIFPAAGIRIPEMSITSLTLGFIFIVYGMWKCRLFELTPSVAAGDIVAAMSNVLFLIRKDGTVSLANQAALNLLGCSEPELIGHPLESIFPEKEWEKIENRLDKREPVINEETIFKTKNGQEIPVLLSISAVHNKEGQDIGMVCVGSDLTDHKQAEEAQKREILVREIHHRVKNNMQIIYSLLSLQSRYIKDKRDLEMIRESQNRIKSMALVHEKLYQSKELSTVDSREYVTDLVENLVKSYSTGDIRITVEVESLSLGVDTAVPCGLIINELVSNALKHAFPDRKGEITVEVHAKNDTITLEVCDNGVGIPEDIDIRNEETLGLRLVTMLAEDQLNGQITVTRDKGTAFCITFRDVESGNY